MTNSKKYLSTLCTNFYKICNPIIKYSLNTFWLVSCSLKITRLTTPYQFQQYYAIVNLWFVDFIIKSRYNIFDDPPLCKVSTTKNIWNIFLVHKTSVKLENMLQVYNWHSIAIRHVFQVQQKLFANMLSKYRHILLW